MDAPGRVLCQTGTGQIYEDLYNTGQAMVVLGKVIQSSFSVPIAKCLWSPLSLT